MQDLITQNNQPPGVPPLSLTGERTLPDVPQENYWFQRHLVVYQWIAARCHDHRVLEMAFGEGYGADLLARTAREVVAVDANEEAHRHASLRYRRQNLSFELALIERYDEGAPYDAISFLQTVEHLQEPTAVIAHMARLLRPGGSLYISTPNRLTLAPNGAVKSENPWHIREYTAGEFLDLLTPHFARVDLFGVFHARKLKAHDLALKLQWDWLHQRLGLTGLFYSWFTPAIATSDFRIGVGDLNCSLDLFAVCMA